MRFDTKVVAGAFDEASGAWDVTFDDGSTTRARHLVAATGVLSVPFFPDVPGRDDFKGEQHHTGRWPATPVDLAGKRVAVIGTGSSGVQIIPVIAPEVAGLTVYQRTPNWCTRSEEHTSELQSLMRISYAVFCLKKKQQSIQTASVI